MAEGEAEAVAHEARAERHGGVHAVHLEPLLLDRPLTCAGAREPI